MIRIKRLISFLGLVFVLNFLFAIEKKEQIVAKYDSSIITMNDINLYLSIKGTDMGQYLGAVDINKDVAKNIVFEELMAKKAIKEEMEKTSGFINDLGNIKKNVLIELFMQDVNNSISVTEEEIKSYYNQHIEEYTNPKMRQISYIFFDFGSEKPTTEDETRALERAKTIWARIKAGEDFHELAIKYSDAPSGRRGGNLGFIPKGKYQSFDKEAWSLKVGETSEPIKTKYGYCIIKFEEEKDSWITPLENVKSTINDKIQAEKKQRTLQDIKNEYKKNGKIVENFDILNKPDIKDEDVIFKVADFKFTYSDFLNHLDANNIDRQLRKEQKEEILSRILEDNLYVNIARDKGYEQKEEYIKKVKYIENNMLTKLFIEKQLLGKGPSEIELQDFFKKNYSAFEKYTNRRISMIFIGVGPIENPESMASVHYAFKRIEPELNMIQEKLKSGENFDKLAQEYSDDPSAKFGGDVGWIQESYKQELNGYIRNLKLNDVSEPIKTSDGYYFLRLTDIRSPELKEIRTEVTKVFENEKRTKIRNKLKEELLKECKVEFPE